MSKANVEDFSAYKRSSFSLRTISRSNKDILNARSISEAQVEEIVTEVISRKRRDRYNFILCLSKISGLEDNLKILESNRYQKEIDTLYGLDSTYSIKHKDEILKISGRLKALAHINSLESPLIEPMSFEEKLDKILAASEESLPPLASVQRWFSDRVSSACKLYKQVCLAINREQMKNPAPQDELNRKFDFAEKQFHNKVTKAVRWALARGLEVLEASQIPEEAAALVDAEANRRAAINAREDSKLRASVARKRSPIMSSLSKALHTPLADISQLPRDDFLNNHASILQLRAGESFVSPSSGRKWFALEVGGEGLRYFFNSDPKRPDKRTFGRSDSNSTFISRDEGKTFIETQLNEVLVNGKDSYQFLVDKDQNVYDAFTGQKLEQERYYRESEGSIVYVLGGHYPDEIKVRWHSERRAFLYFNDRPSPEDIGVTSAASPKYFEEISSATFRVRRALNEINKVALGYGWRLCRPKTPDEFDPTTITIEAEDARSDSSDRKRAKSKTVRIRLVNSKGKLRTTGELQRELTAQLVEADILIDA